jgi:5-methylcytosine-specific restriction endonuclease McrA
MNIVTRAEAKAAGLKQYFTGKPCKHGHVATRYTVKGTCSECLKITTHVWRTANPDVLKESHKNSKKRRIAEIRIYKREYYKRNAEKIIKGQGGRRQLNTPKRQAIMRNWRERNAEHRAKYQRDWKLADPEKYRALAASYRSKRRVSSSVEADPASLVAAWVKRTPKICYWCDKKCAKKYHIDHYEPLAKGGRHQVGNLVIACPTCNLRKNAKDPLEFAASVGRLF